MKRMITAITAVLASLSLTGCSMGERVPQNSSLSAREIDLKVESQPKDLSSLSTEPHGYGQGREVDEQNRTVGALGFNNMFGHLSAKAINEDTDLITLTFDQGYENGFTGQILDTLKEKNVHAVFFLVQDYAERNPDLVRRMIDEGHTVGNHSVNHYSMPALSEEEARQEIMGCHDYVKDHFGVEMTLFRPPMGEFSELSLGVTAYCGYETVLWSFAYADWDTSAQPDPAEALERVTSAAHPGAIYLLHSVSQTNAQILGQAIDDIRAQGYEFT